MAEPDIYVPLCPRCGDPVTSGCYPADGICAIEDDPGPPRWVVGAAGFNTRAILAKNLPHRLAEYLAEGYGSI